MHTYPSSTIIYCTSNMILNVHSDVLYLTAPNARSRIGGHFFLGKLPADNKPIFLNGPIVTICTILCVVAALDAETKLRALFHNTKEAKNICLSPSMNLATHNLPLLSISTTPQLLA